MAFLRMQDLPDAGGKKKTLQAPKPESAPIFMEQLNPKKTLLDKYKETLYQKDREQQKKHLWEYISSGAWKGRRCFIVGGGTSLKDFDFDQLKGELVITVNRGFESYPFSVLNIAQDSRLWGWYETQQLGAEALEKFRQYKGFKIWLNVQRFPFPEEVFQIFPVKPSDFNWDNPELQGGLPIYGNSGLNAITVALCLGASPIYLLGFDMYGMNGRTANFHSGYPDWNTEGVYKDNFLPDFKDFSWRVKTAKVINLNPKSELRYFDFDTFDNIPKIKRPIIVSFYTEKTGYEVEIERLKESVRMFGFEYDFFPAKDRGSWRANIHGRIEILRNFLNKYPGRDIVYIDADGCIVKYPELFDNFEEDLGIVKIDRSKYWKNWEEHPASRYEYLGGTMYMKNNGRIRKLLDRWEELDAPMKTQLSQQTLIKVIESMPELRVNLLPPNYCQIFDTMAGEGEPVVEHFQASRRGILYLKMKEEGVYELDFGKGKTHE